MHSTLRGDGLAEVISFDRPVVAAADGYSDGTDSKNRAVCHAPVVAKASDGGASDFRNVIPHVERKVLDAPIVSLPS